VKEAVVGTALLLIIAGCSPGASEESLQQASDRASQAEASLSQSESLLSQAEQDLSDRQAELDEALRSLAAAEENIEQLEATVTTLTDKSEQLQDDLDAVLLQFDPQIQTALASLEIDLADQACAQGRKDAQDGSASKDPVSDLNVDVPGGLRGRTLDELVDTDLISAEYTSCYKEERAILQEKREQAQLIKDKGDGFYTVGEEMAAGTWRSTGGGDSCYWERLSGFSGDFDDIITNYFGSAGVTVTISSSDKAFKAEGCGTWEYLG